VGAIAALLALAGPSLATAQQPNLPSLLTAPTPELSALLAGAHGTVRAVVSLRTSPVLEAASSTPLRQSLQQRLSAAQQASVRRGPAFARSVVQQVEQRRQAALAKLAPAVRKADAEQRRIVAAVLASGGHVESQSALANTLIATVPARALLRLAARHDVVAIAPAPVDRLLDLATMSAVVGAPSFWAAGFTGGQGANDVPDDSNGSGPDLSIESDKIQEDHPAFAGIDFERPQGAGIGTACGSGAGSCDHGTAVASLAISRGASGCAVCAPSDADQKGVAPGLDTVLDNDSDTNLVYDSAAWEFGLTSTSFDGGCSCYVTTPGAQDPAEASSGSFGHHNQGVDYDSEAQAADLFASQFGDLESYAAGNDGTPGSVNSPCIAYDVICAGGVDYHGTTDPTDDTISTISSQGPTPAGRKKPDLVAVGNPVQYARRLWQTNGLWASSLTGTSFANPQVAAAGTLLEASGVTDPLAVRGILIDSARRGRAPGCSPSPCAMGTQTGWQPDWGWGELDLTDALAQRLNHATGSVPGDSARLYRATVQSAGDRATLTWNRRATGCLLPGCGTGTTSAGALTNLDLKQLDPATCTVQTASTSTIDNVEQVRAPAASTGQQVLYDIRASSPVDGLTAEPFALAATRALTPLASPTPTVALSASSNSVEPGQNVTITATVTNNSADLSGDSADVTLDLPAGIELVQGDPTQQLGSLSPAGQAGDSATANWVVRATRDGNYSLTAATHAQHCGEHFADQASAGLVASTPPPPPTGGGQPPVPAPTPTPTPTPVIKLAPHLRLNAPAWRHGRLHVTGSIARGAAGHLLITYDAERRGRRVHVRARASIRRGRFSALLRLPRQTHSVRATLTVAYSGSMRYKPQTVRRHIR
jgi:Subtilase family